MIAVTPVLVYMAYGTKDFRPAAWTSVDTSDEAGGVDWSLLLSWVRARTAVVGVCMGSSFHRHGLYCHVMSKSTFLLIANGSPQKRTVLPARQIPYHPL